MSQLIHERIVTLMESEGISQSDLSRMMGINGNATISRIVKGQVKPSFNILIRIIELFPHASLEWLLRGNGEMYIQKEKEDSIDLKQIKKMMEEQNHVDRKQMQEQWDMIRDLQGQTKKLLEGLDMFNTECKKKELR